MKNFKIAEVIDFVFINLLVFLILFVWCRFFNNNLIVSLLVSIILLIIFNLIKSSFKLKKQNSQKISKNLELDIEQYMLSLLSNTTQENLQFFLEVLKNSDPTVNTKNNFILLKKTGTILCPMFQTKNMLVEPCLKALNKFSKLEFDNVIFLCVSCEEKTKIFLQNLKKMNVKVYEKHEVYFNILKPNNRYPQIMFEYKISGKLKFKQLLNISFSKKRAKNYFFSGILIFVCSFIVRHNFYYVFMSSLLFLFATICIVKKETPKSEDIL